MTIKYCDKTNALITISDTQEISKTPYKMMILYKDGEDGVKQNEEEIFHNGIRDRRVKASNHTKRNLESDEL